MLASWHQLKAARSDECPRSKRRREEIRVDYAPLPPRYRSGYFSQSSLADNRGYYDTVERSARRHSVRWFEETAD